MTNNTGNSAASRDIANYLHPYTNLETHRQEGPLVITRAEGVRVFDEDGRDYLESLAGLWCVSLGFSEPRLIAAAHQAMQRLTYYHGFTGRSTDIAIDLAESLIKLAPVPMSKVFFANSGSEANDTALKLVTYYNNALGRPRKKLVISRHHGYHGVTVAAASLTGLPANHAAFDLPLAGILHTECPHHYRYALPGESEEDFSSRLANALEDMILTEGPDRVAAFIAEPVMGAGGVILPPAGYFEKIQQVLRRYDVLLIADEVICGFGRLGTMWGCQAFDIKPDIVTCAKALSSGYLPISAVMISEPIYQAITAQSAKIGTFGHGFTYSGHPVPAAVALETLRIYQERDILGHVNRVGPYLQQRLRQLQDHPLVGHTRGMGLIGAIELTADKAQRTPFDPKRKVGPQVVKRAQHHGLIVRSLINDTIALSPPLIITEAEIDELFDKLTRALDDTAQWVAAGES